MILRRLALVAAGLVGALLLLGNIARATPASVEAPQLAAVASLIAGQPVTVRCWGDSLDPDYDDSSWGYVYLDSTVIYLSPQACAGALGLAEGTMLPLWELALGALTLTHESYHLKAALPWWRRQSEAQTECRAVKRVRQTMIDLGSSETLADAALPWALAEHYKITALAPVYDWPGCRVPVFSDFWG